MQNILKHIPKVDKLLALSQEALIRVEISPNIVLLKQIIREFLEEYRNMLLKTQEILTLQRCVEKICENYKNCTQKSLQPLINATGIIVHTNLGRSVFSQEIIEEIMPLLTQYSNLEYSLELGERGERYTHLQSLFKVLLNAEDVLVVNNNAAAVFLILNTFAKQKEVLISRGELIEIGGSFRIPKVMEEAQAILREVGTTNKTHLYDYSEAINANTTMLFKAHRSNYSISGFTKEVAFSALVQLARANNLIDYYDLGSGYFGFSGLDAVFRNDEPSLESIAKLQPSLVSFSGDKLLGGAQAGIIFGKKALIEKLKKNQLLRMLRVDKFTIAVLEATLKAYLEKKFYKIPTLKLLLENKENLYKKAQNLAQKLSTFFLAEVVETKSFSGGGAMPEHYLESFGVCINAYALKGISAVDIEVFLRQNGVIARIQKESVILDVRTLLEGECDRIVEVFRDFKDLYAK